jgi:hypothetical protein
MQIRRLGRLVGRTITLYGTEAQGARAIGVAMEGVTDFDPARKPQKIICQYAIFLSIRMRRSE